MYGRSTAFSSVLCVGWMVGRVIRHRFKYSKTRESASKMIRNNQPTNNRHYIAYLCTSTSETRGRSDQTTIPCNTWQTRASKQPLEGRRWNLQAKCPACGNRPRLSGKNAHVFKNLESAHAFISGIIKYESQIEDTHPDWNNPAHWSLVKMSES